MTRSVTGCRGVRPEGEPLSKTPYAFRKATNELRRCSAAGCERLRSSVSPYCRRHRRAKETHGHPLGRAIKKRELRPYVEIAREILAHNKDHPGVQRALQLLGLLLGSPGRVPEPLARELCRLRDAGLGRDEALEIAVGTYLYYVRFPSLVPDDDRLTFALGTQLLSSRPLERRERHCWGEKIRPQYRQIPSRAKRLLGEFLRQNLVVLLHELARFIEAEHAAELSEADDLSHPFISTKFRTAR